MNAFGEGLPTFKQLVPCPSLPPVLPRLLPFCASVNAICTSVRPHPAMHACICTPIHQSIPIQSTFMQSLGTNRLAHIETCIYPWHMLPPLAGPVSDVLFVQAVPTPTTSATDRFWVGKVGRGAKFWSSARQELMGILNQASIQLSPPATHGVLDEAGVSFRVYSSLSSRLCSCLRCSWPVGWRGANLQCPLSAYLAPCGKLIRDTSDPRTWRGTCVPLGLHRPGCFVGLILDVEAPHSAVWGPSHTSGAC